MKALSPQVLAMYLGCEVLCDDNKIRKFTGICQQVISTVEYRIQTRFSEEDHVYWQDFEDIKPILRKLSSMTEEECYEVLKRQHIYPVLPIGLEGRYVSYRLQFNERRSRIKYEISPVHGKTPEAFAYLLSRHFDLFNLISDGLAIEKKH